MEEKKGEATLWDVQKEREIEREGKRDKKVRKGAPWKANKGRDLGIEKRGKETARY